MYAQAGLDPETSPFPADEIIRAREAGALGEMLPSGTEFPVTFTDGEGNVLVVCRDDGHTYLVTKHLMAKKFAMNDDWTNKGGWPACRMRKHVQGIYDMLPEDIRKVIVPMHIRHIFRETAARIKKIPGASIAWWWWLRSAYGNGSFSYVRTDGSYGNTYADTEGGVAVGFCIETRK